ncbi:hypothetical protein HRbin04_01257 [archaeon HR04]|nr:hypothetical protein HRbin04_01257 [archaeon HR04]
MTGREAERIATTDNNNSNVVVIRLKDRVPRLDMRITCNKLFDYIESLPNTNIIVDFTGFDIATRSFIHQYIIRKEKSEKRIEEINLSPTIEGLFKIVKKQIEEPRILQ